MKFTIINILCEGQTEERFVKDVLRPYFSAFGIVLKHRLLCTSKKKGAMGGMLSYQQAKHDLTLWMAENRQRTSEEHYYTTMFDLYALPNDFPGYADAEKAADPYAKVKIVEDAFLKDVDAERFIPYVQLHEFEALLFCDVTKIVPFYPERKREIEQLSQALIVCGNNPEFVDNGAATAPSKRIINAVECGRTYHYNKPLTGSAVAGEIGIDKLMAMCAHFRTWIENLLAQGKIN